MNTLPPLDIDGHFNRLRDWLRTKVPEIDSLVLYGFDLHDLVSIEGRAQLAASALLDYEGTKSLFSKLCEEGREWLNLSGYGYLSPRDYLVVIEYNEASLGHSVTAVNVSGPPLTTAGEPVKSANITVI